MCGIDVKTQDREILSIAGDKANPFSEGHVCPKAAALKDIYDDPSRLKQPMRRTDDGWEPMTWDAALDLAAQKLFEVQQQHGKDAVGVYLGNPNAHNMGALLYGPHFYRMLGSKNRFSATSVDQLPHHIVSRQLFGHQLQIPIPDIDHTDYFVIIGGNPLASNGSIMTVPHIKRRLKAIQQRGGKVVVIDPKRSETADVSSQHLFVKPGTDVLLLLAMINTVFAKGLADPGHVSEFAPQLEEVQSFVAPYSAQRVARHTGIEASEIEALVEGFCAAERAVCYGRMGASVQQFGTLCQYLIMLFNMLTGNFDRRGGMMFTQPAADTLVHGGRGSMGRAKSRVRGLPGFAGELPVSALAEEILTEGEGQIKAMVLAAGNPVISTPNGEQVDKALASLDFVLAVDFFLNESTRHADLILPPVMALERDHYDLVFHNFAIRNSAKFSPAVFAATAEQREDWQIYIGLCQRLAKLAGADTTQFDQLAALSPTKMVDGMLRQGRYANGEHQLSIDALTAQPHGVDLGPLQPELPGALYHENQQIDLKFDYFMPDLARVEQTFFASPAGTDGLLLIGRRHLKSNNSWLHNSPRLMRGNHHCTAQLHSQDAEKYGVSDGQRIRLVSRVGEIEVDAEVTDSIMPGVVSVPHGWGHDKAGTGWTKAAEMPGANVNVLTDEMALDVLSGNAILNGVPVSLEPVS